MPILRISNKYQFQISTNFKLFFLIAFFLSLITYPLSLIPYHFSLTHAQTPLEKAQQDYTYQFSKYHDLQQNYISSKASYEAYRTATAKNEAFIKTKDYLAQIDSLYVSYLLLIKEYSGQIDWTYANDERIKINQIFDDEMTYLDQHLQKVKNVGVLEELPPISKDLKEHIEKVYQLKINKILATYEITRTKSILEEFKQLSSVLDDYVYSKYPTQDNSVLLNWRSEINGIENESNTYLDQAVQKFTKTTKETIGEGELKEITSSTTNANGKLQKSRSLFEEILRLL